MSRSEHPRPSLHDLEQGVPFVDRHIGPRPDELATMLAAVGVTSLDELADRALPAAIRDRDDEAAATLPPPATEIEALTELRALAGRNTVTVPMIGLGYSGTVTPPVIRRNVLRTRPGTPLTRPTSPRSARAGWRRCSPSRPRSRTSPVCPSPARRCWTRRRPRRRR